MALVESSNHIKHGDTAPSFTLKGTDGNKYSLEDVKGEQATLVIFMCNHCPYVIGKLDEMNKIYEDFKDTGLTVIGINANDADNYPEDSFEHMQDFVKEGKVKFLYVYDESQEVAKKYDAQCTPDPFLFDKDLKLVFHSRIGDPPGQHPSKVPELYDAINEFLETGSISAEEKPSMGCSIKWK